MMQVIVIYGLEFYLANVSAKALETDQKMV